jgi:hypothetical protein
MNLELEIGLALAVVALALAGWHWIRRQRMTRTKGSIIRSEVVADAKASKNPVKSVKITVRFNDGQGLVRFFTGAARGEERKPGDSIAVLYRPSDPQHAEIDDLSVWVAPIVVGAIGIGLAAMGVLKM